MSVPLAGVTEHPFAAYAANCTTAKLDDLQLRDHVDNPFVRPVPKIGPALYDVNKVFEGLGH